PDAGADLGHEEGAGALAGDGQAGHRPGRRDETLHVRDDGLDAAAVLGIEIVGHGAAVLAVVAMRRPARLRLLVHAARSWMRGSVEISPLRTSSKPCRYSPRLRRWETWVT